MSFPLLYYINLEHREDRKTHLLQQLKHYPTDRIHRIDAVKDAFGGLGCTRSHIKALAEFIKSGESSCIILEDDFTFYEGQAERLPLIIKEAPEVFDVIMLSSFTRHAIPYNKVFRRCISAQTASGYMVSKKFAIRLLNNFMESEEFLSQVVEEHGAENVRRDPFLGYETYALDQYWKKLQPHACWLICEPRLGYQMNSYSDIELADTDYGL